MDKTDFDVDREKMEVRMKRVFNAPRELVWKAHTDRDLIPKWWGPRNTTTIVEKMDLRTRGEWRFVSREGKKENAFYGRYKEIKEPELITWTFNYEPIGPGHEIVETVKFEDVEDGPSDSPRTKVSTISYYNTVRDLEGMVDSGMEKGAVETWDRLAELLEEMKR